jgi:phage baseplate assembly protein gpV
MIKNSLRNIKIEVEQLNHFYRGVVEDNKDPLKAGRVRVRIHGLHTYKKTKSETDGIPTEELPWAEPCMPIHEGSVSGFGSWAVPLQGSQVMLFFENGNVTQPRYFASMPGIPESKDQYSNNKQVVSKRDGFRDPDGNYPVENRLGEPDVHRLARGISDETLVTTKNQQRQIGVQTAFGGQWSEPQSPYAAKYPHNHVIATHGGITIELDSTPGSTRLHLYHPSNSYIEIDNDGNMVVRNNTEKYEIVAGGKNIYIKQQRNLTVDEKSTKKVGTDEDIEVGNNKREDIGNDFTQTIANDKTEDIGNNKTEEIGGNKTSTITNNKTEEIGGNKTSTITNNKTEEIGGNLNITVTGNANITAPVITLTGLTNIIGQIVATGGSGGTMDGTLIITGGDVIADGISLKNHTHAQGNDSDGNSEVETNPPT